MQTTFVPCKGDALGHRVDVGEQRKLRVRSFVFKCGGMSRTLVLSAEVSPETLEVEEAPLMLLLLHLLGDNVRLESPPFPEFPQIPAGGEDEKVETHEI